MPESKSGDLPLVDAPKYAALHLKRPVNMHRRMPKVNPLKYEEPRKDKPPKGLFQLFHSHWQSQMLAKVKGEILLSSLDHPPSNL
jgi:hypothetical protein